jgi:hypothetical protein
MVTTIYSAGKARICTGIVPDNWPEYRNLCEIWQQYATPLQKHELGDLATAVRYAWAKRATAGDLLRSECLLRRVEAIEARLSRPDPSQLERLLVKRVGAAYLSLQVAEIEAAAAANAAGAPATQIRRDTLARLAAAERMFQSAAKALALYQTMTRPRPSPADLLRPVAETTPAGGRRERIAHRAGRVGASAQ